MVWGGLELKIENWPNSWVWEIDSSLCLWEIDSTLCLWEIDSSLCLLEIDSSLCLRETPFVIDFEP